MSLGPNMMRIDTLLCPDTGTILDVMQVINANQKGCAFVVDADRRLCGVLTDGDIRRRLLTGGQLRDGIGSLLKREFVFAYEHESYEQMLSRINDKITILPIVNDRMQVTDYFECRAKLTVPVALPDLRGNEFKYLTDAFLSTWISSRGCYIEQFEQSFASYCGCQYGIAVSNGTCALHLALLALGIGPGDEVIVPDLTFAASANAVLHAGARPVLVDVEPDSWCIDPAEMEKAISPRTRAVIVVHLLGQPANMDPILSLAARHQLYVVEDCAEAHGAEYAGKKVGGLGDVGCFSFYANKVITCGEGGMCVTHNATIADKIRMYRDHGMSPRKKYWHEVVGYNYRMTNLQAAIGLAQMERIDDILEDRHRVESAYRRRLFPLGGLVFQPNRLANRKKITWLVSCLLDGDRDGMVERLRQEGIDCRPFFYSLGQMPIYAPYVFSNAVSRKLSVRGIMFPTSRHCDQSILDRIFRVLLTSISASSAGDADLPEVQRISEKGILESMRS